MLSRADKNAAAQERALLTGGGTDCERDDDRTMSAAAIKPRSGCTALYTLSLPRCCSSAARTSASDHKIIFKRRAAFSIGAARFAHLSAVRIVVGDYALKVGRLLVNFAHQKLKNKSAVDQIAFKNLKFIGLLDTSRRLARAHLAQSTDEIFCRNDSTALLRPKNGP